MRRLVLRLRYHLEDWRRKRQLAEWLRQQESLREPRRTRDMW